MNQSVNYNRNVMCSSCIAVSLTVFFLCVSRPLQAADWPQAAGNMQRTSYTADQPAVPLKPVWTKELGARIYPNVQPVIKGGHAFLATEDGVVHCLVLASGKEAWRRDMGAPVVCTLAVCDTILIVPVTDGTVHGLSLTHGKEMWRQQVSPSGFSAPPLIMKDRAYVAGRDGRLYPLDAKSGKVLWSFDTGAPIDQAPSGDGTRVVFANMAMHAFCVDADKGCELWKTRIPGGGVRGYWPVIHKGKVVFTMSVPGYRSLSGSNNKLQALFFAPGGFGRKDVKQVKFVANTKEEIIREQEMVAAFYKEHPDIRTCIILDLDNGMESAFTAVASGCVNTGTPPPPVMLYDGNLYYPFRTSAAKGQGFVNISHCGVGRLDVNKGRIAEPLLFGQGEVGKVIGCNTPVELTSDETISMTGAGKLFLGNRADTTHIACMDLETREQHRVHGLEDAAFGRDTLPAALGIVVSDQYVVYQMYSKFYCLRGKQ